MSEDKRGCPPLTADAVRSGKIKGSTDDRHVAPPKNALARFWKRMAEMHHTRVKELEGALQEEREVYESLRERGLLAISELDEAKAQIEFYRDLINRPLFSRRNLTPEEQRGLSAALAKSGTVIGTIPLAHSIQESAALPQSPQEGMEPVAWLHQLHTDGDQTMDRLSFDEEHNFGEPGRDYSPEYYVTTTPLFALSSHSQEQEGKS